MQFAPADGFPVLHRKFALRLAHITGKTVRAVGRGRENIACQRLRKRPILGGGKRRRIGRLPAVERLSDFAHFPGHGQVPHPHFPQARVHVPAERVEQPLAEAPDRGRLPFEPAHEQDDVQHDHLETAVNRIGNTIAAVKRRLSRLRHDHAIERGDGDRAVGRGETDEISSG